MPGTANENGFGILALTEHLLHEENNLESTRYEVRVNDRSPAYGTLEAGNSSASVDIPPAELKDGLNSFLVPAKSDQQIYFNLSTPYDLPESQVKAAGNIMVTRRYLDPKTKAPIKAFQAGQLVKVEVRVQVPENTFFLAVEDYLPSGLEALRSVFLLGVIWGIWHWPVIWMGYNYPGQPILGSIAMVFVCVILAYFFAYAVFKSNGIWTAAYLHALNNQALRFFVMTMVMPTSMIFSFGMGIPSLVLGAIIVLLILRDPIWKVTELSGVRL